MIDPGLEGRVALVTGANHGIGAAVASALAAQGVAVGVSYLRRGAADHVPDAPSAYVEARAGGADWLVEQIERAGGRAVAVEADLADAATSPELFEEIERELGSVEILVNNASGWVQDTFLADPSDRFGRSLTRVSAATIDAPFAIDARAAALLIAKFADRYVERGSSFGRIISVTSSGRDGFPEEVSYGAAKAALESYTLSAAWELGRLGVTANVVHPPATDTGWITSGVAQQMREASPPVRIATPEEVAEVVVYLASEQARWLTGQRLRMS